MVKSLIAIALLYVVILVFSLLSEVTYRKRSIQDVMQWHEIKRVALRQLVLLLVCLFFGYLYFLLGLPDKIRIK